MDCKAQHLVPSVTGRWTFCPLTRACRICCLNWSCSQTKWENQDFLLLALLSILIYPILISNLLRHVLSYSLIILFTNLIGTKNIHQALSILDGGYSTYRPQNVPLDWSFFYAVFSVLLSIFLSSQSFGNIPEFSRFSNAATLKTTAGFH